MQVTKKEAERIFKKLEVRLKQSTHHNSGWVMINGKKTFPVHYSRGKGDMPGPVGIRFAKSFGLNLDEFSVLKRCTMTKEQYHEIIMEHLSG